MTESRRVMVGLSGGVDSSVAALRLKKAGYDVIGVFIKVWHPEWLQCDWEVERLDAMRVAAHLQIPFLTCDAEAAYKQGVADYFISEYIAGRTPNPDVMCNQVVKFGAFIDFAKTYDVAIVATGHYAQLKNQGGSRLLYRGSDATKDQSYFLWTLTEYQRTRILLPVGNTPKVIVRNEAAKAGIPVADKKDSQGICFLGQVDIPEFLNHYTKLRRGPVLDAEGTVIGEHSGALVYTLGQRHGFTIKNSSAINAPQYVIARDINQNTITVGNTPQLLTPQEQIVLHKPNYIGQLPNTGVTAQFRYRQTPIAVETIALSENKLTICVTDNVDMPASGQSCVLYEGDRCLGGGIIA